MLKVDNLSHTFGDKLLYKNICFELFKGEHMGLVGENGCGKSTLFSILINKIIPDSGEIAWQKNISIGYLDQHANLDLELSIFEYLKTAFRKLFDAQDKLNSLYMNLGNVSSNKIMNEISRLQDFLDRNDFYQTESKIMKVTDNLGINSIGMNKLLKDLSGGQRTKVILAKLLLEQPDVLLLDEPTNFLDKEHIKWLTEYLSAYKNSFIVISHDFNFLDRVTNCICEIEFCGLIKYKGSFNKFIEQKGLNRDSYIKLFNKQQKQIQKLEDYIARNKARASTAKLAKSRQKQLDKIDRLSKPENLSKPCFCLRSLNISSHKALVTKNLEIGYDYPLLNKINISIEAGEKTVITGFNGIGKTTLLKTLIGEINAISGSFRFADNTKIGYFRQDLDFINRDSNKCSIDIVSNRFLNLSDKEIRKYLAQCALKGKSVMQPACLLSGGEQTKIKICLLMLTRTNFLILDEPTNHLDANSKEVLKEQLSKWAGNLILVSHEEKFYKSWVDKVINIGRT